jgi:hypothetical protein
MSDYDTSDLIHLSIDEKPLDFAHALADILGQKVFDAVEARRTEVANDLFVDSYVAEAPEEVQEEPETQEETPEEQPEEVEDAEIS